MATTTAAAVVNRFPIQAAAAAASSPSSGRIRYSSASINAHHHLPGRFPSLNLKLTTDSRRRFCAQKKIVCSAAFTKLSESDLITIPGQVDDFSGKFPSDSGVYAVYDKEEELQFVGVSRNISASLLSHWKSVPDLCSAVKIGVVDKPDRTTLTEAWKSWMEEHIAASGKIPPGNESGNAIWVKRAQKKADLRLTPGRNVQLTVPLEELIDRLVKENKVVAFIKGSRNAPQCGFSQKVVGILESQGIDYQSVDVLDEEHNAGLRETLKRYSNWPTFPQVFVNGELVGGCDILVSMQEQGELATLLKK